MAQIKGMPGTGEYEISYQHKNKNYDKYALQKLGEMKTARRGGHARRKPAGWPYTKQIVALSGRRRAEPDS